jgi:hypothetical protein
VANLRERKIACLEFGIYMPAVVLMSRINLTKMGILWDGA